MAYGFRGIIRIIAVSIIFAQSFSAVAASYDEAMEYFRAGSFQKAHSEFSNLADQGNTNAKFQLGLMAHLGHGIPQNFSTAQNWYLQAAKAGEARSQNNLGIIYRDGLGTPPDPVRAYKWFSLAASQRNEQAITNLRMLRHHMDKTEILNGQRLAREHYDEVNKLGKQIKSASKDAKPLLARKEMETPKPPKSKIKRAKATPKSKTEIAKVAPKTVGIDASFFRILESIIAPAVVKNTGKGTSADMKKSDLMLINVPKNKSEQTNHGKYFVQLGLFKNSNNVKNIYSELKDQGIQVFTEKVRLGGNRYKKLRVGPYVTKDAAETVSKLVNKILGIRSLVFYQGTSNQVEANNQKKDHL